MSGGATSYREQIPCTNTDGIRGANNTLTMTSETKAHRAGASQLRTADFLGAWMFTEVITRSTFALSHSGHSTWVPLMILVLIKGFDNDELMLAVDAAIVVDRHGVPPSRATSKNMRLRALAFARSPQTVREIDVPAATASNRWSVALDAYQV